MPLLQKSWGVGMVRILHPVELDREGPALCVPMTCIGNMVSIHQTRDAHQVTPSTMPVTGKHSSTHANRHGRASVLTFSSYRSSLWRSIPGRLSATTDTHGNILGTALPNEVVLQTGCRSYRHR